MITYDFSYKRGKSLCITWSSHCNKSVKLIFNCKINSNFYPSKVPTIFMHEIEQCSSMLDNSSRNYVKCVNCYVLWMVITTLCRLLVYLMTFILVSYFISCCNPFTTNSFFSFLIFIF